MSSFPLSWSGVVPRIGIAAFSFFIRKNMAGPRKKQGLDYFPHDVDLSSDEKIQLVEAEHGLTGYAVYVKLLERIYRNGYFIQADDKFIKLLSKSLSIDFNICKNIIISCTQEKLFDEKLFKNHSILTSKGIQTRYLEAASRRQQIEIIREYCLLNGNNFRDNVNIISINVDSNAHRIGEDRIGEESNTPPTPSKGAVFVLPEWFSEDLWKRFIAHRKAVKAPIEKGSYPSFLKKFLKLNDEGWTPDRVIDLMVEKGWRWFKPEWIKEDKESDWSRRLRQSD